MSQILALVIALELFNTVISMNKSDVKEGVLVRFNWNQKQQNDSDLQRRAIGLNKQFAVIMKRPFLENKRRVSIQSIDYQSLFLGVKIKYLELLSALTLHALPTLPGSKLIVHVFYPKDEDVEQEDKYLVKEQYFYNDATFDAVLTAHRNTTRSPDGMHGWESHDSHWNQFQWVDAQRSGVLDEWKWFHENKYDIHDIEAIFQRFKRSLKGMMSRLISRQREKYGVFFEDLDRLPITKRFRDTLWISWNQRDGADDTHGAPKDIDWLPMRLMDDEFMNQCFIFIHDQSDRDALKALDELLTPWTKDERFRLFIEGLKTDSTKLIVDSAEWTWKVVSSLRCCLALEDDNDIQSRFQCYLEHIKVLIENLQQKWIWYERYRMCRNIGITLHYLKNVSHEMHNGTSRGIAIAVMPQRDLENRKDGFAYFVLEILEKLKWHHSCISVKPF